MKHTRKYLILPAVVWLLFLTLGCRKDKIIENDTGIYPEPTIFIEAGVRGVVTDESGNPISDALVFLSDKQTQTNENGYFQINYQANSALPFIRIEKPGFFPSIVSFSTQTGGTGRLKAMLRAWSFAGELSAGTGGVVNLPNGGSIRLEAGGFVNTNGQPYNGIVLVYASYLDPSTPQVCNLIPGAFLGRSATGANQILTSFGMMHVLLVKPSGQKLQISKPAQITIPVPADRLSNAPANIPLWYLDESTALWKEEGTATLQGNAYTGYVNHFSWWNCDIGAEYVRLSGQLKIGAQHPFVLLRVTQSNGLSATTTPDDQGYFSGGVPANSTFRLEAINECDKVVYSAILGPYSSDTDIGTISLDWTNDWVNVQGKLVNCDQQPVTNGAVVLYTNGIQNTTYFPIKLDTATGTFTGAVSSCGSTEVTLVAVDLNHQLASAWVALPVGPTIDFGHVTVCDTPIGSGLTLEYGGKTKFIPIVVATYSYVDSLGAGQYKFIAMDDQGFNGHATYHITVTNWSNDPKNPLVDFEISTSVNGIPLYYTFILITHATQALALGTQPGQQAIFREELGAIIEQPAQIEYSLGTITISAILQ